MTANQAALVLPCEREESIVHTFQSKRGDTVIKM